MASGDPARGTSSERDPADPDRRRPDTGLSNARDAMGSSALVDLDESLTGLAPLAERGIAGADGVGITVVRDDSIMALAASNSFVLAVDAVQYRLAEGPCVTAMLSVATVSAREERAVPQAAPTDYPDNHAGVTRCAQADVP